MTSIELQNQYGIPASYTAYLPEPYDGCFAVRCGTLLSSFLGCNDWTYLIYNENLMWWGLLP